MNIGFMVNDIETEGAVFTTTRLAMSANNQAHDCWHIGAGDFAHDAEGRVLALARSAPKRTYKSAAAFLSALRGRAARVERISVDELDVLMLRSDPSIETGARVWARTAGIDFGRVAVRKGVVVVNDPNGLAMAANKMYFELFPEEVRPRALISRDRREIRRFIRDEGGTAVLKPLRGSGGRGVFLVRPDDEPNLNQMVDAIIRDDYVIAQEYVPAAAEGDTRLFLLNGRPFRYKGKYAAFRRVRSGGDMRSNIHAGGSKEQARIGDTELKLAEIVRPKLVQDGMFLVGLDIAGDKLLEINVFTPGGLGSARLFEKVNFARGVIDALERKVDYMRYYHRNFDNAEMCTL